MLKTFTTHLRAINPDTLELTTFEGPYIQAESWDEAELYCYTHGFGYLVVNGELKGEYKEDNLVKILGNVGLN